MKRTRKNRGSSRSRSAVVGLSRGHEERKKIPRPALRLESLGIENKKIQVKQSYNSVDPK